MNKKKVIFFTGAGISVDSGIPTFQEQPGIRDKLTRDFANEYPEEYRNTIRQMLDSCENASPNAAHIAIAEGGFPVITMNVDQLHTKAGSKNVIEVHGVLPTREELEEELIGSYANLKKMISEARKYKQISTYKKAATEAKQLAKILEKCADERLEIRNRSRI